MNYNKTITDYISKAAEEQIEMLEILRELIHKTIPGTTEEIKWRMPVFATTKNYCYFRFAKKHITFGFYNFEKINDPKGLLEGEGTMRHVKIKSKEDINKVLFVEWLKAISL